MSVYGRGVSCVLVVVVVSEGVRGVFGGGDGGRACIVVSASVHVSVGMGASLGKI